MATQTQKGKAFEYACLVAFEKALTAAGKQVEVKDTAQYKTAKGFYEEKLSERERENYDSAANTAVKMIFPLEPRIEHGGDTLVLTLNADRRGEEGDVRDLLCIRISEDWEIGFSCKHNHEALKHPRITRNPDFGSIWVGYPCSEKFIDRINDIRGELSDKKRTAVEWNVIEDKMGRYYGPILEAFREELDRICKEHPEACTRLLEYFFGSEDFYKIISHEAERQTKLEGFNMYDTMNRPAGSHKPITKVKKLSLPTRLIDITIKPGGRENERTTMFLYFDYGWTISMRLHNKDRKATKTSLAWDVKLAGMPPELHQQQRSWDE